MRCSLTAATASRADTAAVPLRRRAATAPLHERRQGLLHRTTVAAAINEDSSPSSSTQRKRLAVFVSGGGSNLRAIHAATLDGRVDADVVVREEEKEEFFSSPPSNFQSIDDDDHRTNRKERKKLNLRPLLSSSSKLAPFNLSTPPGRRLRRSRLRRLVLGPGARDRDALLPPLGDQGGGESGAQGEGCGGARGGAAPSLRRRRRQRGKERKLAFRFFHGFGRPGSRRRRPRWLPQAHPSSTRQGLPPPHAQHPSSSAPGSLWWERVLRH